MDRTSKLRILVLGYIVRRPLGGGTWPTLQYTLGLKQLGHDVYFLEDSEDYPCCYDPSRHITDENPTFGLAYAADVFNRTGLGSCWAYHDAHKQQWHGPCKDRINEICSTADLLLNIANLNTIRPWLADVPHRAYIDIDPAFEQIRQITDRDRRSRARRHTAFFTIGENIARGTARVPDDGIPWQSTRNPVVLDCWPVTPAPRTGKFSTVMLWDSYPARDLGEFHFGMKSESFGPYLDLPDRVDAVMEMALGGPTAPRRELAEKGWSILDPLLPTKDPWTYQQYIQESRAEFTVAKHGYVVSNCGWFSERSANYLASGRPVITQETGFSEWLPAGEGVLSFSSREEALEAIHRLDSDFDHHCRRAREVAKEYFDSHRLLSRLVDLAMEKTWRIDA